MVLLHVKQKDDRQFLYESSGKESVDAIVRELVVVNNLQVRILGLKEEGKQLALHGPLKAPRESDEEDSDDDEESANKKPRGPFYCRDPSGHRTGEACDPQVSNVIIKAVDDAIAMVSKEQVIYKVPLTAMMLKDAIQTIRGSIMICYPMGLPSYDPVQQAVVGTAKLPESLDPDTAHIWWAGKELMRNKCLQDHIGKNEKTKVIVKLQDKGQGCPPREPPIDAETHKAMLAWHYRQQEQQKTLALDEDDAYTNSQWANPKALKSHLSGVAGNMKIR